MPRGMADYLLVVVVAVVLHGANVVGYTKCSKQASAQLKSYATQAVTSGLTVRSSLNPAPFQSIHILDHVVMGVALHHMKLQWISFSGCTGISSCRCLVILQKPTCSCCWEADSASAVC
jgi:hypothetical protein